MTEFFLIAAERVDWGFDNPNKTGAFFGLLLLACWLPVFIRSSFFSWSLLLSGLLAVVVVLTQSRGAVVAALVGLMIMGWAGRDFLSKGRWIAILGVVLALALFSWLSGPLAGRFAGSVEDRSVLNRLVLWDAALHMIHDAPDGWGRGQAADAFHQWYQQPGVRLHYKNLVNSHLTWLVEWGIVARWAYLLAWGTVLVLCFPLREKRWYVVAFSCWLAFGLMASFSSVAHVPLMWLVPTILMLVVFLDRCCSRCWPRLWCFAIPIAVAALFFSGLQAYVQLYPRTMEIHLEKNLVLLGRIFPSAFILRPDPEVLGSRYGHVLREWVTAHPQQGVAVEWVQPAVIPPTVKMVLLSGEFDSRRLGDLSRLSECHVVWLNPVIPGADLDILKALSFKGELAWGALRSRPDRLIWQQWAETSGCVYFREIPGAAEYVSSWPDELRSEPANSGTKAQ